MVLCHQRRTINSFLIRVAYTLCPLPIALRADFIVFLIFLFTLLLNVTFIGEAYFFSSSSNSITFISKKKSLSAAVYGKIYTLLDYFLHHLHKLLPSISAYCRQFQTHSFLYLCELK